MENGDDWLATDKLEHVLFGFFISIISSLLAARTRYFFIRRRSIWVGSVISFSSGAAKEFADELGFFNSAGASAKDAVADLLGILLAAVLLSSLSIYKPYSSIARPDTLGQSRLNHRINTCPSQSTKDGSCEGKHFRAANDIVTAGFRWAPEMCPVESITIITANPVEAARPRSVSEP
ncbi:hypothetical protein ACJIZ3_010223 [Penstemon smallii]|uniref:Uncharacterized protein n=1 Tax=Penstemon smallii TaxID=265156 RepID=A0ABD3TEP6_9LAMI